MARKPPTADQLLRLDNQICFAIYSTAHAFNRVYKPLLERLFLDSGTLTPLLKRLEQAGFIKRTRSTEDERQVLIGLTSNGQALKDKARSVPPSILAAAQCSVAELSAVKNEIVALRDRLNAAAGV